MNKEYYEIHKKRILKQQKIYQNINKDKLKKYHKKYNRINKDKKKEYDKQYRLFNKKQIAKYQRNRRKVDINFKLACYLRNRMILALKGNPKLSTTMKLVGCSIELLKNHLKKQFTKGMTWVNYGKWHIDHIRPCASFDLSKVSEQKKCFHYTNLQPLWAEENMRKHDN